MGHIRVQQGRRSPCVCDLPHTQVLYHQAPSSGSCLIPGLNHLGFSPAPFSHLPRKQEGVSPLDIPGEINDTIIMTIKPKVPKEGYSVGVLECTRLRTHTTLKFAELPFVLCECGPPHLHTGLGTPWIAVTLLSVRQQSQINLRCSGTLYTGPRQRELQSNEMPVPTGMLLKEGAGKGSSDSKRQRN